VSKVEQIFDLLLKEKQLKLPESCKLPTKCFDFNVSKVEQIFDLLLKEKLLKLPEGYKLPIAQEL
jgi:hypothetical protein